MRPVPLVDLACQHAEIADEVERGMRAVCARAAFVFGDEVQAFEEAFARSLDVARCVSVANGTDAIELMLRAKGIGPGDEVVLPANTFMATPLAVLRAGAQVVIADVDPTHLLLDPDDVARRIGPRTRAIIGVHLFGQLAPMAPLLELARPRGLEVFEDGAQAHGARQHGHAMGALGVAAATSFYPGKNLGAYGDGGAVLTQDAALADKLRALRNYGSEHKYEHPELGFNSRLDTLQAVVLLAKLARLERWNEARRQAAARYDALLAEEPRITRPRIAPGNTHVFHLYVVRVARRDAVLSELREAGIGAAIHYPRPVHLQGALAFLGHRAGDFPNAEAAAAEILSLPLFPGITEAQQSRVAEVLLHAVRRPR